MSVIRELLEKLQNENINDWGELGAFIDRLRDNKAIPNAEFDGNFEEFKAHLSEGIGFLSFHYGVYGVTVEMSKYASAIKQIIPDAELHFIAGNIPPEADSLFPASAKRCQIAGTDGFGEWELFDDFFHHKLQGGSHKYQHLFRKFWEQTLQIVEKLGAYIVRNNIRLLYALNICSNPGNVSLSLASVLLSEYLKIPVISNHHEFYWESGTEQSERRIKGLMRGTRDFYFTNAHLGDFFSLIEMLFPWESRSWFSLNINRNQSSRLIDRGHNPANVAEIDTAVNTKRFSIHTKRRTIKAQLQVEAALKRYGKRVALFTPTQILEKNKVDVRKPQPILVGASHRLKPELSGNNIVLLQPTRITLRKRIEVAFWLVNLLFQNPSFIAKFENNPKLTLTVLVSGSVPIGQVEYFNRLIYEFDNLLQSLPSTFKNRLFLGFLFGEIDTPRFKKQFDDPIGMPALYNIASLVMLPSETEGRGLPLIEATASGTPIFCRRYKPERVYAEVIGEHLNESERLKVLEFDGSNISEKMVNEVVNRIFFPQNYFDETRHNRRVVQKRFSLEALRNDFEAILYRFYLQLGDNGPQMGTAVGLLSQYRSLCSTSPDALKELCDTQNREYVAGYGRLAFLMTDKALASPSFFRTEEQVVKGFIMRFATKVLRDTNVKTALTVENRHRFYNIVDNIFHYYENDPGARHDHALAYLHKHRRKFLYQSFSYQEITGLVNMIFHEVAEVIPPASLRSSPHFFTDWKLSLLQLTNSPKPEIDDRDLLLKRINENVPIGYFPGKYIKYEVDAFILQTIRLRLKLKVEQELTEELLKAKGGKLAPVYLFCLSRPIRNWLTAKTFEEYVQKGNDRELQLLVKHNICQIVKTDQWAVGIHLHQLGDESLQKLLHVKQNKGFIISNGEHAATMTDILDIDRFHIGKASKPFTARMLGIEQGNGFIQFAPAGIRTTVGYPMPIQTARDFHELRQGRLYRDLCRNMGEASVLQILRDEAAKTGAPAKAILQKMKNAYINGKKKNKPSLTIEHFCGMYEDNMPYTGVFARLRTDSRHLEVIAAPQNKPEKLLDFVERYNESHRQKLRIAWNGGYVLEPNILKAVNLPPSATRHKFETLNPLVNRAFDVDKALPTFGSSPTSLFGTPLGLLIADGKLLSPPLLNRPAFMVDKKGRIRIEYVNCSKGIKIHFNKENELRFPAAAYNKPDTVSGLAYYDLMHSIGEVDAADSIVVHLAGCTIIAIHHAQKGEKTPLSAIGLSLCIPRVRFPKNWKVGMVLDLTVNGLEGVVNGMAAGPLLVQNDKPVWQPDAEGWTAHRADFRLAGSPQTGELRSPRIIAGIDEKNNLMALAINGRIRESVGATQEELAVFAIQRGMKTAMAFAAGSYAALYVDGEPVNIPAVASLHDRERQNLDIQPGALYNIFGGWKGRG